jgi:flagellar biosynthesis chaperone FliJ
VKRFTFRPARLERLRDLERRASRAALARAIGASRLAAASRDRELTALAEARSRPWALEAVDAAELKHLAAFGHDVARSVERAERAVVEAEEAMAAAARRHAEDSRAHRALEKLRARRWRRWLEAWEREQQKLLDETYLARRTAARGEGR